MAPKGGKKSLSSNSNSHANNFETALMTLQSVQLPVIQTSQFQIVMNRYVFKDIPSIMTALEKWKREMNDAQFRESLGQVAAELTQQYEQIEGPMQATMAAFHDYARLGKLHPNCRI